MKLLLIFALFLLVGAAAVVGYYLYANPQQNVFNTATSSLTTKFSMGNAPSESLKGKIASMSGTITWLSRTAAEPVQLKSPRSVQQGEELQTGKNGKLNLLIHDSIQLIMSPSSDVTFVQMLPINIVLSQDKGTVYYQESVQSALSIRTLDLLTTANRAWALISVDPDNQIVTVTVQRGSVIEGYEDAQNNTNVVTVNAGQQFIFDEATRVGTMQ